ncbi:hypothetical protein M406DRAFT_72348 [Cryphonectria parasitica EP155]|uniref:Uncharacterized protein n=1 Tax=Cryphonectria parasitica (strain ATCC 38755 / EP155) TaxID=660469 RepID=A0A9P5CLS5_CRYP1|nr:uncharacterized protein M406DRAFT_72348 [Cryphonectria parasitica EP155]KAF3762336.1 hypothetical protein M406DRAFT_72348 [Cryphonectria parasitica EP155]
MNSSSSVSIGGAMGTVELANNVKSFLDSTQDKQDEDLLARINVLKRPVETNIELILDCDPAQYEDYATRLVKLKRSFATIDPNAKRGDTTRRLETFCRGLDDLLIETEKTLGRKSLGTLNIMLDEPAPVATRTSRDQARIRTQSIQASTVASRRDAFQVPPISLSGARFLSPKSPAWKRHRLLRPSSPRSPRSPRHIRSAQIHLTVRQAGRQA